MRLAWLCPKVTKVVSRSLSCTLPRNIGHQANQKIFLYFSFYIDLKNRYVVVPVDCVTLGPFSPSFQFVR